MVVETAKTAEMVAQLLINVERVGPMLALTKQPHNRVQVKIVIVQRVNIVMPTSSKNKSPRKIMSHTQLKLSPHLRFIDKDGVGSAYPEQWLIYNVKNQNWYPIQGDILQKCPDIWIKYQDEWSNTKYFSIRRVVVFHKLPTPFSGRILNLPGSLFNKDDINQKNKKPKALTPYKQQIQRYREMATLLPKLPGDSFHLILAGSPPLQKGSIFYQYPNISLIVNTSCPSAQKDKEAWTQNYNSAGVFQKNIDAVTLQLDVRRLRNQSSFMKKLARVHQNIYHHLGRGDVVVHCLMGQHRSAFTIISYWIWLKLIKKVEFPFLDNRKLNYIDKAYQYLQQFRPIVESRNFPTLVNEYHRYLTSRADN